MNTMRAIKITVFQSYANYKMPGSHQLRESFPLPPYSTVIGMIHKAADFKEYVPMDVSIQGKYDRIVDEAFIRYEFKPEAKYEEKRHQLKVKHDGKEYGIGRGVGHVQLLIGVGLTIHILVDESKIKEIYNSLKQPRYYLCLGRHEDMLRIDNVEIVELKNETISSDCLKHSFYIPVNLFDDEEREYIKGTIYDLTKTYKLQEIARGKFVRKWDRMIEALHTSANTGGDMFDVEGYIDEQGDYAFFA